MRRSSGRVLLVAVSASLLLAPTCAVPVSHKAVNPNAHEAVAAPTAAAPLAPKQDGSLKQMKLALFRKLHDGAKKVGTLLTAAAPLLGIESTPMDLSKEAAGMYKWWCAHPGKAKSTVCERRAMYAKVQSLSGDAKKAEMAKVKALSSKNTPQPNVRKAMHDETKEMVQSYCKTPGASELQICIRSMTLIERARRIVRRATPAMTS